VSPTVLTYPDPADPAGSRREVPAIKEGARRGGRSNGELGTFCLSRPDPRELPHDVLTCSERLDSKCNVFTLSCTYTLNVAVPRHGQAEMSLHNDKLNVDSGIS